MTQVKLSLGKKARRTNVERKPSLGKRHGKPRKKLRGFALAKLLKEEANAATGPSPSSDSGTIFAQAVDANETVNTTPHEVPLVRKRHKSKPPPTSRRTRSNPLRRSVRGTASVTIFDPSPCDVPDPSYVKRAVARQETLEQKRMSVHSSSMINKLMKHSDRYRFLYYEKVTNDFERQKRRIDSAIVLASHQFPKTTTNEIKSLIINCEKNTDQNVSRDLLYEIGYDGAEKSHDLKMDKIVRGIQCLFAFHFSSHSDEDKANMMGKMLVQGNIFGQAAGMIVASTAARCFSRRVFSPWRLLKMIDSKCQGALNDGAVRDYCHVEADCNLVPFKRGHSLLPNRNHITACRKKMNNLAGKVFDVQHNKNPTKSQYGDHVQVDYESLIRFLVNSFGLKSKAISEGVELVFTADGAKICGAKNASQTAAGIKVMDPSAIDPDTGQLMFVEELDSNNNPKILKNYQTFKNHALAEIILHGETKTLVNDVFRDFFKFGMRFGDVGLPARGLEPAFKAKKSYVNADMSLQHKCVGRGGACKIKKFFCYCCECHGEEDMFALNEGNEVCKICRHNNRTKCRHRRVNDLIEVNKKTEELLSLLVDDHKRRFGREKELRDFMKDGLTACWDGYDDSGEMLSTNVNLKDAFHPNGSCTRPIRDYCGALLHSEEDDEVISKSSITYCPEALLSSSDINNIDYDIEADDADKNKFIGMVLHDLDLRGYDEEDLFNNHSKEEWISLLRNCLKVCRRIKMLRNCLTIEKDARRTQFVEVDRAIPCILHANNRTSEKLLEQILEVGLDNCFTKKERDEWIRKVEHTVNCSILGKMECNELGQWRLPMKTETELGDVKLSCPDANKLVGKMGLVVEVCAEKLTAQQREDWMECARLYALTMDKLKSRKVFSFHDVCDFQQTADSFGDLYIHLTGGPGMTNYFHFIFAGHFAYYLIMVKNLYKYSQQGWEHINGKAKRAYNHNTQRGGGQKCSSKLLPIVFCFLRELLWRFKFGEKLFMKLEEKVLFYGKRVKQLCVADSEIELMAKTIVNIGSNEDIYGNAFDDDLNDNDSSDDDDVDIFMASI